MTQDEIMRMAREAGLQPYYDEQVTAIARFAAIVAATEREKCTNTQEFVTLPREVVEQALKSILDARCSVYDGFEYDKAATALAAAMQQTPALEQPQNHVPDAGNMVPAGWKLVPVEPTRGMLDAAHKDLVRDAEIDQMLKGIHSAMLAAAPQPPTVKECLTVEQPQVKQEPVAKVVLTEQLGLPCLQWLDLDRQFDFKGGELLYTHPQPKREPLTDEQIDAIADAMPGGLEGFLKGWGWRQFARAILKAAHNIK